MSRFYELGRMHALSEPPMPPNPNIHGATNPQEYNEYMNGYNSVLANKSLIDISFLEKQLFDDEKPDTCDNRRNRRRIK